MICPNEGKELILNELFSLVTTRESFKLDVFVNNYTIIDTTELSDLTLATWTGYAQIAIARGGWDAAYIDTDVGKIGLSTPPSWTCSGGSPQTAYGWVLHGATSGLIYFAANLDTPVSMIPGATLSLDPFEIWDKSFTP